MSHRPGSTVAARNVEAGHFPALPTQFKASYQLLLLDGFQLERHGRSLSVPQAAARLLAFLGLRGRTSRAEIAGNLWPEVSDTRAQASLRTVLWRLRQSTEDWLVDGGQSLSLAPVVAVDVAHFVDTARRLIASTEPVAADGRSGDAALMRCGELLPGWYDDWVLHERERLRQLKLHSLESVAVHLTATGRHAEAIDAALMAVRLEPLRESATRALIMAHLAEHNVIEALRCFESFRDSLREELGVAPTAGLERLLLSDPVTARP